MQEIIIFTLALTLSASIWTGTTNAFQFQLIQNNRKVSNYHGTSIRGNHCNTFLVGRISGSTPLDKYLLKSSGSSSNESDDSMDMIEDENPFIRDPEEKYSSAPVSAPVNPLSDPLMRMATKDTTTGTSKTANIPLLGEVPMDGNFAVLAPVIGIGFLGILASFVVAFQSRDKIRFALESVNSAPPKETKVDVNKCRGICSNQAESFDAIEKVMNSFVKKSPSSPSESSYVIPTKSITVSNEASKVSTDSSAVSSEPKTFSSESSSTSEPSASPSELNTAPLSAPVE